MARRDNPSSSEILETRMAQIARAYKARLRPRMSANARDALERERKRQIRLARAEFRAAKPTVRSDAHDKRTVISKRKSFKRPVVRPRRPAIQYPIGGIPQYMKVRDRRPKPPPAPDTPTWRYHAIDGAPLQPWDVMTHDAEGRAYYPDEGGFDEDSWMSDEDYSYDDIEADWGGYDHQDTGYEDENA